MFGEHSPTHPGHFWHPDSAVGHRRLHVPLLSGSPFVIPGGGQPDSYGAQQLLHVLTIPTLFAGWLPNHRFHTPQAE
jgi:hypothetical protein